MKPKYKLGTLVETNGEVDQKYGIIESIIFKKEGASYILCGGIGVTDKDIVAAFRPIATRTAKKPKAKAPRKRPMAEVNFTQ
jgi:hypothetical protein